MNAIESVSNIGIFTEDSKIPNEMSIFDSDRELVQGILAQDDKAINYLYKTIGPRVKHIIVNAGGSSEEADDIFQEGIIAAYVNIKSGKYTADGTTKFTTYLTQICKYKWYDVLKSSHKKTAQNELVDKETNESIHEAMERSETYTALHELIDSLGDQCKKILMQFYWEKKSIDEISQSLKMVPASVKNGKYRCMQKLKDKAQALKNLM